MNRLISVLAAAFCTALIIAAPAARAADSLNVVTTIGMVGNVVENVAGDRAQVTSLMGEGVDPHLYKATRSDIARMLRADVVFYNGLLLEGKMTDALVRVATKGKAVFAVTELIDKSYLLHPKAFEGHSDPHVWMDPAAWIKTVQVVRDRLVEIDPANAETYQKQAAAYAEELKRLDTYAQKVLDSVPASQRVLVTAHRRLQLFRQTLQIRGDGHPGHQHRIRSRPQAHRGAGEYPGRA